MLNLSDAVAGAWIGGNIDTTAAVAASGAIAGEDALQIATIVKTTQNALIGFVAIALTAYFALKVERKDARASRPTIGQFWERFPKFVLGFIAASIIGTLFLQWGGDKNAIATVNDPVLLVLRVCDVLDRHQRRQVPLLQVPQRQMHLRPR